MGVSPIRRNYLFYAAVLFQIVILLVITSTFYLTDIYGREVSLKTEPVDPTDILYGDYVDLHYDIQTLPKNLWKSKEPFESSKRVYVVLKEEENENHYIAKAVYTEKPKVKDDEVIMVGKFNYLLDDSTMFLTYGIEKYYIPEGTGKQIEEQRNHLLVKVLIAPWGQKKIKDVEIIH